MLIEEDIVGKGGDALVWIIDGQCLYDLPILPEYVSLFTESDEVLDVTDEYINVDGIIVRFFKDGVEIEDLQVSEYFGTILLSTPQVESLFKYPYGQYVISPDAEFDGEQFIITNKDVTKLPAWHPKNPNTPAGYFDEYQA